jgi:hypothetical protein
VGAISTGPLGGRKPKRKKGAKEKMNINLITHRKGLDLIDEFFEGKIQPGDYIFQEGKGWTGLQITENDIFVHNFDQRIACEKWLNLEFEIE